MSEDNIKKNSDVELKEYKIISKFMEKNEEEETAKDIDLPTPESFEKLCSLELVKNFLSFDMKKYQSLFETKKEENKDEKTILNLDKITSIINGELIPYIMIFIGGINSNSDIYNFFDETVTNPGDECFIDNSPNYLEYLNSIIDYLKNSEKLSFLFSQMELLFKALDEMGINIKRDNENVLSRHIKESFFSIEKNKILVILAPSNNFWVKSEKRTINDQNYDIKLNNYSYIFYNKPFIKKFLTKIARHTRCTFGLLCSMNKKNLKNCWEGLEKQFSNDCPKTIILFDQTDHIEIKKENEKKPHYFRSMTKIVERLKKEKAQNNKRKDHDNEEQEENIEYFNEKNIIIVESEEEKMGDTKSNSILVNTFDEEYWKKDKKERDSIDLDGERAIDYVYNLLENCNDDIRAYMNLNKFS
jgi:hypothetical protein